MLNLAELMRPKTWAEVIGNEHIVRAITKQLEEGNLSKAIMITGIHGSGKSTIGKLIASSLDAEIHEIDCGSDGGVDRIREVVEAASVHSLFAREKVFVLDEVHALSKQAQSALLKTLEESTEGVFVLLTTNPQSVLPTIRSRCVVYETKPASREQIGEAVKRVLDKYDLEVEDMSDFWTLVERSEGSLRVVYSHMEKLVALAEDGVLTSKAFQDAFGEITEDEIDPHLPKAFMGTDYKAALEAIDAAKKSNNAVATATGLYKYLKAVKKNNGNIPSNLLSDLSLLVANKNVEWEHLEWLVWRYLSHD